MMFNACIFYDACEMSIEVLIYLVSTGTEFSDLLLGQFICERFIRLEKCINKCFNIYPSVTKMACIDCSKTCVSCKINH